MITTSTDLRVKRRSLAQEVVETLRESLCRQAQGTRLPSERDLARQVKVSVTTLRKALTELLASGEIKRVGKKTFVGRAWPSSSLEHGMHPFLRAQTRPPWTCAVVDMVTYEHLPAQKRCWTRLVDAFSAARNDVHLRLIDLPHEVNTTDRYARYVKDRNISLAVFANTMLPDLAALGVLGPLPDDVFQWQCSDESLWSTLCVDGSLDEHARNAAALHCGFSLFAWNTELTGDWSASPSGPVDAATATTWLGELASCLPPDRTVMVNPAEVLTLAGWMPDGLRPVDLRRSIRDMVDLAERLQAMDCSRFAFEPRDTDFTFRRFAEGQAAFVCGNSFMLLDMLDRVSFPWRAAPVAPASPYRLWQGTTMIGVTADGEERRSKAHDVIRFLMSPAAQTIMAEERLNCPVRKASVAPLADFLGLSADAFLGGMSRLHVSSLYPHGLWVWFIHTVAIPYINSVLAGSGWPGREEMVEGLEGQCRDNLSGSMPLD